MRSERGERREACAFRARAITRKSTTKSTLLLLCSRPTFSHHLRGAGSLRHLRDSRPSGVSAHGRLGDFCKHCSPPRSGGKRPRLLRCRFRMSTECSGKAAHERTAASERPPRDPAAAQTNATVRGNGGGSLKEDPEMGPCGDGRRAQHTPSVH